jgi:hypothetical protein
VSGFPFLLIARRSEIGVDGKRSSDGNFSTFNPVDPIWVS